MSPLILVGQLYHESHWFTPLITTASGFVVERNEDLLLANRAAMTPLGGILRAGDAVGVRWAPTLAARAVPSGPVDHATYLSFRDEIVDAASKFRADAICLELHGSMRSTEIEDIEGDLLTNLRECCPETPIAVVLDLHGIVTDAMLSSADICIGYKTAPHADMVETGEKCMRLLLDNMEKQSPLVSFAARVPLILGGEDETTHGPLKQAHALACKHSLLDDNVLDVSIFNGFPWADSEALGQTVVALAKESGSQSAQAVCENVADFMWRSRGLFQSKYLSLNDAFALIAQERDKWPFFLGDAGDRVLGGTPGDSTEVLSYALAQHPELPGFVPVFDPEAVLHCFGAGVGADVSLAIGADYTPGATSLKVEGSIKRLLSEGVYVNKGPFMAGNHCDIGKSALVTVNNTDVALTSKPPLVIDQACFDLFDIEVSRYAYFLAKTASHFKINFSDIGETLVLDTNGLSTYHFSEHAQLYQNCRPIFPIDSELGFHPSISMFSAPSWASEKT